MYQLQVSALIMGPAGVFLNFLMFKQVLVVDHRAMVILQTSVAN